MPASIYSVNQVTSDFIFHFECSPRRRSDFIGPASVRTGTTGEERAAAIGAAGRQLEFEWASPLSGGRNHCFTYDHAEACHQYLVDRMRAAANATHFLNPEPNHATATATRIHEEIQRCVEDRAASDLLDAARDGRVSIEPLPDIAPDPDTLDPLDCEGLAAFNLNHFCDLRRYHAVHEDTLRRYHAVHEDTPGFIGPRQPTREERRRIELDRYHARAGVARYG